MYVRLSGGVVVEATSELDSSTSEVAAASVVVVAPGVGSSVGILSERVVARRGNA